MLDRIKKKGYRLKSPLSLLDPIRLTHTLTHDLNLEFKLFESIDSTQTALKQVKPLKSLNPLLYLAEQQTKGRGRLDRTWYSPFGQNLYLTLRYTFQKDMSELSGLSLVVALSMAKTAEILAPQAGGFAIKWPNDLLYQDKKLGGCLIEVQAEAHGVCTVWIGIGLNINSDPHPSDLNTPDREKISQPWTSLKSTSPLNKDQPYFDRTASVILLIKTLLEDLTCFEQSGFQVFQERWHVHDALLNHPVTLQHPSGMLTGIASGVTEDGHLLLKSPSGDLRAYASGDVIQTRKTPHSPPLA